jgi:hypothetical protein
MLYVVGYSLNSHPNGTCKKGPVFEQLLNGWNQNVDLDNERQIKFF